MQDRSIVQKSYHCKNCTTTEVSNVIIKSLFNAPKSSTFVLQELAQIPFFFLSLFDDFQIDKMLLVIWSMFTVLDFVGIQVYMKSMTVMISICVTQLDHFNWTSAHIHLLLSHYEEQYSRKMGKFPRRMKC